MTTITIYNHSSAEDETKPCGEISILGISGDLHCQQLEVINDQAKLLECIDYWSLPLNCVLVLEIEFGVDATGLYFDVLMVFAEIPEFTKLCLEERM